MSDLRAAVEALAAKWDDRARKLYHEQSTGNLKGTATEAVATCAADLRALLSAHPGDSSALRDALLTPEQLKALADFLLLHGDIDKDSVCLTAQILRNKAEAARRYPAAAPAPEPVDESLPDMGRKIGSIVGEYIPEPRCPVCDGTGLVAASTPGGEATCYACEGTGRAYPPAAAPVKRLAECPFCSTQFVVEEETSA